MPALVSHFLFADSVQKEAQAYLTNAVSAAPMAFRWGAQGPDLLFYHNPLSGSAVSRVGHRMHEERVAAMFSALTEECARLHAPEATAYLLGFCCHYILDRSAHPFVTYIANYRINPLYPQLSVDALHNLCEAELDRALISAAHEGSAADYPAYMLLSYDRKTADSIAALLSNAVWRVYGVRVTHAAVRSAMHNFLRVQRLLHDKNGHRHTVISWFERRMQIPGTYSSLIRPAYPIPADCTNSSHQAWIDASLPHLRQYMDYFQILNQAQRPASHLMEICYDAAQTGKPLPGYLFALNYAGAPE